MMHKILIVKTSSLGDLIHTYPVVNYLRQKFPESQIDWVVEAPFADLVACHPSVNHALTVATKAWRRNFFTSDTQGAISSFRQRLQQDNYDVVFDLQGNTKSGVITFLARSPCKVGFGWATVPEWPNMLFTNKRLNPSKQSNIREEYLALVAAFFQDPLPAQDSRVELMISPEQRAVLKAVRQKNAHFQGPHVVVCPGSAWRNKQLTLETLQAFLRHVQSYLNCHFSLVWGSNEEQQMVERLYNAFRDCSFIVDKMSLPMLQNFMEMGDLVIAMDSLPLHLAGTTKTPSFSVFGASSATKYSPSGKQHGAFQGPCPYGRTFEKRCPVLRTCPTGACIRNLQADEVFCAFKSWWKGLVES